MALVDNEKRAIAATTPLLKAACGSAGGVIEAALLQPMNTVTHRLQLDKHGEYRGVANCFSKIAKEEGVSALWKGTTPFAVHLTLKYALRMGTNATFQNAMRDSEGKLTTERRMAAGFAAGVVEALAIVTPFGVLEIALQTQRGAGSELKYKGPLDCAQKLIRQHGIGALFKGWAPTVGRNGTNQMCLFSAKAAVDSALWDKHEGDGRMLASWQSMTSGFLAGCVGPFVTAPFDVVRTRLMAQDSSNPQYRGMLHCAYTTAKEEGVLALYKGLVPRLMRVPPGQAIVWAVSDRILNAIEQQAHEKR
ncbi:hypothetical protein CYMTET_33744 [Cymbomonas tetramitiformis]|uniref:Uncharacterized protein n=1 Tax=Cymbomonas tetramitiformis TaxID=36881 RepID=A0AAE0FCP5_9CHLO|nr:hypothetical protein CYMTET_33744 [Cymbomonas tetramitiformis]